MKPFVSSTRWVRPSNSRLAGVGKTAIAEGLAARGWPCLRISFSGNGNSEGRFEDCTVSKECDELSSIIESLPPDLKIAYAGHSMGGGVGVRVAASDSRIAVLVTLAGMLRLADFHQAEFGDATPDQGLMWDEPGCPLSKTFANDMTNLGDLFDDLPPELACIRPLVSTEGDHGSRIVVSISDEILEQVADHLGLSQLDDEPWERPADWWRA